MTTLLALDLAPPYALVTRSGAAELIVLGVALVAVAFFVIRAMARRKR